MSREYPQVSLTPLEIERLLSYLRPIDDGSHLKKKLLAARGRCEVIKARDTDKRRWKDPAYNWVSTGPDGCDSHCIPSPCGPCMREWKDRSTA